MNAIAANGCMKLIDSGHNPSSWSLGNKFIQKNNMFFKILYDPTTNQVTGLFSNEISFQKTVPITGTCVQEGMNSVLKIKWDTGSITAYVSPKYKFYVNLPYMNLYSGIYQDKRIEQFTPLRCYGYD